jgi:two-component system, chemotaxis family, sensor histidine kinase and response regulator WspE
MSSSEIDASLLELFREDVRAQVQILNNGLVELERSADPRQIEPLMRAAHSVKGAARLVGIDPAVRVAHVMEDCLVAVQQGRLKISSRGIDALLQGTDILAQSAEAAGTNFQAWSSEKQPEIEQLLQQLEHVFAGNTTAVSPAASAPVAATEVALPPVAIAVEAMAPWHVSIAPALDADNLALFQGEVQQSIASVRTGLEPLKKQPAALDKLKEVGDAVRTIRGAALLMQAEPLATIAGSWYGQLQLASSNTSPISESQQQLWETAIQQVEQLAHSVGDSYLDYVAKHESKLKKLANALHATMSDAQSQQLPTEVQQTNNLPTPPAPTIANNTQATPAAPVVNAPLKANAESEEGEERVVRVTAKNLTRLMGLAGESLVEARWLQPFAQSLVNLKREQDRLADVFDELAQSLVHSTHEERNLTYTKELRSRLFQLREGLTHRIQEFESHARRSDDLNSRLYNEVIASRMRPMSDGVQGYPRMVRDISRQLGKAVQFEIQGDSTPVDRDVLEKLDAPLNHILRNALDHGIESAEERIACGKPEVATMRLEVGHYHFR